MSAPYPWLEPAWLTLTNALASDRLAHAYLIGGRRGLGKLTLAQAMVNLCICEQRAGARACGSCRSCMLYRAGNHPDIKILQPEEERKSIVVDQVRELIEFYTLKAHYQGRKVALVHPADSMNHAAANALLKILEEPPSGALLLLVADRPGLLPATVASRCQRLPVRLPDWNQRESWLENEAAIADDAVLHGAPLAIRDQLGGTRGRLLNEIIDDLEAALRGRWDALAAAGRYADIELPRYLDALEAVVQGAVMLADAVLPGHLRLPAGPRRQLQGISDKLNSKRMFLFLDAIAEARSAAQRSSGVRGMELIEHLMLSWRRMTQMETTV